MDRSPQAMRRRVNIAELDEDRGFRDRGAASSERQSASLSSSSMAPLVPALQGDVSTSRSKLTMSENGKCDETNGPLLLRMRDLRAVYGLVPATVYRWIANGEFPCPVNLGGNSVAWHREEIEEWRRTRPRAKIRRRKDLPVDQIS
jgi:prophage regulatory protein